MNFENYLLHQGYKASSIKTYQAVIVKIKKEFNENIDSLNYQDIVKYMSASNITNTCSNHKIRLLGALKLYYDGLIFSGLRSDHPCRRLFIKCSAKLPIIGSDLFSIQELELLMHREERYKIAKLKNQVIVSLLIYQGLTCLEIANMQLNDVHLDHGYINIKSTGNTKRRKLQLTYSQLRLFENYLIEARPILLKQNKSNCFVINLRGQGESSDSINYLIETFKPLFPDRLLNAQKIRMSVIYNWINIQNVPVEQAQLMAGHGLPSATIRYRACNIVELRKQINLYFPR